ncbi:unnamed protein product [Adineta steineri]|uniref:Proteasome activator complex subunit 4 C-terminal domain-containing protein n=3 Tax=Adineta steineri TaxID=433720 RepID=A0A819XE61_9BILA|nr:unnamed protein product [Adineta steineri]
MIDFIRSLINLKIPLNTFAEISRWSLLQNLDLFEWCIPSIWSEINKQTIRLIDHSSSDIQSRLTNLLALSISCNVKLFNGNAKRHPNVNQLIDNLCERQQQAIEIHTQIFFKCRQSIKDEIIRLFPYLCEIESVAVFNNLFNARPYIEQIHQLVLKYLFDEQLEVRITASKTLSGLYQCDYIQITNEDLEYFRTMSETNYYTIIDGKKIVSLKNIINRHGGILGLCAIVLASPYDIPSHVPKVLMQLCAHSHDPDLRQKSIKQCVSDFRRTHHDSWHYEHRQHFTDDQLVILANMFTSHNYYA